MFIPDVPNWPINANTGTWSSRASYKPLSKWVPPGPADPNATPILPVSFASAAAAIAPTSSWRTWMYWILSFSASNASIVELNEPPGIPYRWSTPQASNTLTIAIPAGIISACSDMLCLPKIAKPKTLLNCKRFHLQLNSTLFVYKYKRQFYANCQKSHTLTFLIKC